MWNQVKTIRQAKNDMHSNTEMIYQNTDQPVPVIYRYRQGRGVKKRYNSTVDQGIRDS